MLALVAAVVAPYFIDWTAYRADFQREASRIVGREVVVKGAASARLLPFPSVTFGDVEVIGDGGRTLLAVDRFRMDAELAPYLSGEIYIHSMTLDRPRIVVPIKRDGSVEFLLRRADVPTNATVTLDSISVNDGSITLENARTGRSTALTAIDANLSAASLAGPVSGTGTLTADDEKISFSIKTGRLQDAGAVPLRVQAVSEKRQTEITIDGLTQILDGKPRFTGSAGLQRPLTSSATLAANAPVDSLAGAAEQKVSSTAGISPLPIKATGNLSLDPTGATLKDVRVAAGDAREPYLLTGTGQLNLSTIPSFTLDLEGEQVDVDRLAADQPVQDQSSGPKQPERTNVSPDASVDGRTEGDRLKAISFADRVEAMRSVLTNVPRPSIPGTVTVSLPVVTAGDTTIRDVAFSASPTDGGWVLANFGAELPGRTRLEASGVVGIQSGFTFKGDLLVASRQPSGLSEWLTGGVDPAVRSLPQAGFSAKTFLTADRQSFENLELNIGGDALTGRMERSSSGPQTSVSASLDGGRVDLDALLALSRIFTGEGRAISDADVYDVALKAGPVSLSDATAASMDVQMRFNGDELSISRFAIDDFAGANLTASGRLSDVASDARGTLEVSLTAQKPELLTNFLSERYPGTPLLQTLGARADRLGPLAVKGTVQTIEGAPEKRPSLFISLDGTADGTQIDLSSSIENGFSALTDHGRLGLDLRLENERPTVLLGQLSFDTLDVGASSPLEAKLSFSSDVSSPVSTSIALHAPGTELNLDGSLTVTPSRVAGADLSVYLESKDLQPWLSTLAIDVGQSLDRLPAKVAGTLSYNDDGWSIRKVAGSIADTAVDGSAWEKAGQGIQGKARLSDLSLPWLAAIAYGTAPDAGLTASGTDRGWPQKPFGQTRLPDVDYDIDLSVDRFNTGSTTLKDFSATLTGSNGQIDLRKIRAMSAGGPVAGRLMMRNASGVGSVALEANMQNFDLETLWPNLRRSGKAPELDGSIKMEGTGQSYASLMAGLTGAGTLHISHAVVPGVPLSAFARLLDIADQEGFVPNTDTAKALSRVSDSEAFPISDASTKVAVAAGVARLVPIEVDKGDEKLTIEGNLGLSTRQLDAQLRLLMDPRDNRVDGADPVVDYHVTGELLAPELSADVSKLSNYLSVRALEREQMRVEAMQDKLKETLRLRREVRFYRSREASAEASRRSNEASTAFEIERVRAQEAAKEQEDQEASEKATAAARAEAHRRAADEHAEQRAAESRNQTIPEAAGIIPATPRNPPIVENRPVTTSSPAAPSLDFSVPLTDAPGSVTGQ